MIKNIIRTKCSCGEPISIETNCDVARSDGKRPFYPDQESLYLGGTTTVFRCRKCSGWLGDTCKEASFEANK